MRGLSFTCRLQGPGVTPQGMDGRAVRGLIRLKTPFAFIIVYPNTIIGDYAECLTA